MQRFMPLPSPFPFWPFCALCRHKTAYPSCPKPLGGKIFTVITETPVFKRINLFTAQSSTRAENFIFIFFFLFQMLGIIQGESNRQDSANFGLAAVAKQLIKILCK
ncbi:MAG: hypothetical protein RBS08_05420 [Bdellovibrionales bacterium]|nr:hypothetical protein [Bdellovibrionales bacterium]